MAKQLDETSRVVANLNLHQMGGQLDDDGSNNSFGSDGMGGHSPHIHHNHGRREPMRPPQHDGHWSRHMLPKWSFPKFDGSSPKIWVAKCIDYFLIYEVPEVLWVRAAALHMEGNAEKWWHVYKLQFPGADWPHFSRAVEQKFGAEDYRKALQALLDLKQFSHVDSYAQEFEDKHYQVCMHHMCYDELFFVSQFIKGLKVELQGPVLAQVPTNLECAVLLAQIQEKVQEQHRARFTRLPGGRQSLVPTAGESKQAPATSSLWRERQLCDYRKANGLCLFCGDKFYATHPEHCPKRVKPQLNAIVINSLDQPTLMEEILNQLAVEDTLTEEFHQLSLNALAGTEHEGCLGLRAMVKDQLFLILVDSDSSTSFINSTFFPRVGIVPQPCSPRQVQVANGELMRCDQWVPQLNWWSQGHSFVTDMRVLDLGAYHAVLGYDWLKP